MTFPTALKTKLEPPFSAKVLKMSPLELRERNRYLRSYLQNISPKVSIFAALMNEHVEINRRLGMLNKKEYGKEKA